MIPLPPRPDRPLPPRLPGPARHEAARTLLDAPPDLARLRRALGQPTPRQPPAFAPARAPEHGPLAGPDPVLERQGRAEPPVAPQDVPRPLGWTALCAATAAGAATGLGLVLGLSWLAIWPFDAFEIGSPWREAAAAADNAPLATQAPPEAEAPPGATFQPPALPPTPGPIGEAPGLRAAAPALAPLASLRLAAFAPAAAPPLPPPLPPVVLAPAPQPMGRPSAPAADVPPTLPRAAHAARAVVHVHGPDPSLDRRALETALKAAGFPRIEWREVDFAIGRSNVRFFHDQDRPLAQKAGAALAHGGRAAASRDFTHFRPPTALGTIEIWVADD